jgi:DNA-3-methyladenine glycosylase
VNSSASQYPRIRRLRRAELPADTIALARFLIGKIVIREMPHGRISGRIVETEAYPIGDPAAHHYSGPTPRNKSMFLRRGHAYVYFSYGNHFMLNISAEVPGVGGGVLIRALEPLEGIAHMQQHRKTEKLHDLTRGPGRLAAALQIDRSLDGVDVCAPGPLWLGAIAEPKGTDRSCSPRFLPALSEAEGKRALSRSSNAHFPPARRGGKRPLSRRDSAQISSSSRNGAPADATLQSRRAAHNPIRKSKRIGITRAAHRLLRFYERGNPFVSGPARLRS